MIVYKSTDVFGVTADVLEPSYVDRGELDETVAKHLGRNTHIALRGESKCGKTWLRRKLMPDAIVIQCRLHKSLADIYTDALSQLGLQLTIETKQSHSIKGSVKAVQEIGIKLLAKLGFEETLAAGRDKETTKRPIGHDVNDLRFISDIIKASGRRLVIEDFHYLTGQERRAFAYDLKALWDYKCFVILIGIWVENNLLTHLNSDLTGRVHEISIYWSPSDLEEIVRKGSKALNISFGKNVTDRFIHDAFGTAGILQKLVLETLDNEGIFNTNSTLINVDSLEAYESAALQYAEQLNGVYQTFSKRVANGIRQRTRSTGIYAHALAVIVSASDDELKNGLSINLIFHRAHERQARIQKGNLRTILEKIDTLQIDEDGRGLIVTYDSNKEEVFVIDKQLLLYRKYATVRWLWDEDATKADHSDGGFDSDT